MLPNNNTNARTLQHIQSGSPINPSTLRNPWQRASRSASQMRSTRRATINHHPLPGKDHHHQTALKPRQEKDAYHLFDRHQPERIAQWSPATPLHQKLIGGLGGPEEDHQLHHCCWTGRVGEREEEDIKRLKNASKMIKTNYPYLSLWHMAMEDSHYTHVRWKSRFRTKSYFGIVIH